MPTAEKRSGVVDGVIHAACEREVEPVDCVLDNSIAGHADQFFPKISGPRSA